MNGDQPISILLIEDSPDDADLLELLLSQSGWIYSLDRIECEKEFVSSLASRDYDIVISDFNLPSYDGLSALDLLVASGHDIPFILISGHVGEEIAADAMRRGARDFILKTNLKRLPEVIHREINESRDRKTRREIEKQNMLLRRALDLVANPMVLTDAKTDDNPMIYVNRAFCDNTGYSKEEVLGKNCRFLQHNDRDQPELSIIREAIRTGSYCDVILRNYRKNGTLFFNQLTLSPVRDEDGNLTHFISIQNDVTRMKEKEDALVEKDIIFRHASRIAQFGTWSYSYNLNKMVWSDEMFSLLGRPLSHPITDLKDLTGIFQKNDQIKLSDAFASSLKENKAFEMDLAATIAGGDTKHFFIKAMPIIDTRLGMVRILGILLDISSRKKVEEALLKSLQQEKELNALKNGFISMVSHEFRTPLGVINSAAHLMEKYRHKMTDDDRKEQIQDIISSVTRLTSLMEDVLLKGKIDSGWLEFNPSHTDIRAEIADITAKIKQSHSSAHEIITDIPDNIPASLFLDKTILRVILSNLLTNAIKYSPESKQVSIHAGFSEAPDRSLTINVKDSGIGIPPEDIPKLFQAFHRASNSSNIPGTGLGLNIVKTCLDIHGGSIRFHSQIARGTEFTFTLPCAEP